MESARRYSKRIGVCGICVRNVTIELRTLESIEVYVTMILHIYTDGGARGNPGPAAIGIAMYNAADLTAPLETYSKYIGSNKTNNEAEYEAVVTALSYASDLDPSEVHFFIDSELVVKQLQGKYKVKNDRLRRMYDRVCAFDSVFPVLEFTHIPREKNVLADSLVNQALDAVKKQTYGA